MCLPDTAEIVRERVEAEGGPRVNRRTALLGAAGAALAASFPASALANGGRGRKGRMADLTHTFTAGFPVFTFDPPARSTLVTIPAAGFYAQQWTFGEHSGTHMDAPGHFVLGGRLSPEITLQELIAPIVVVDISKRAKDDPNAMVEVDDLTKFERKHGRIPKDAIVAMDSGWADKVDDPLEFKGGPTFPGYNFPGFSADAALWLAEERDVTGIGVDTLSLDPGNSSTFPVHVNFLATDRYGLENLANLDQLPAKGAWVIALPMKIAGGSGGPLRAVGLVPR